MRKRSKLYSLLSIVLALTLFMSACSGGGTATPPEAEPTNTAVEETNNQQEEPKEEEPAPEPEEVVIDMQGKPIRVMSWGNPFGQEGTDLGETLIALENEMSTKHNTKFEFVEATWDNIVEKVTTSVMAGEPIADVFYLEKARAIPGMINSDFLTPISDFIDLDDPKWPVKLKEVAGYDGKVYGFATDISGGAGIFYNRAILKKEGLTDPHELLDKGEWTWDAFLDIAKKVTKDTDGDGKLDQYGVAIDAVSFTRSTIASNGADLTKVENGNLVYDAENPAAMEALRFFSDLYHVHNVVKPNVDGNWDDYINSFNQGNVAMRYGEFWEGGGIKENLGNEYGFIYFPKGPQATDHVSSTTNLSLFWVPKGANEDAVKLFIDYLFAGKMPEGEVSPYLEEQFADEKSLEINLNTSDNIHIPDYIGIPDFEATIRQTWNNIGAGKETPETGMAKVRPVLEGLLKASEKK